MFVNLLRQVSILLLCSGLDIQDPTQKDEGKVWVKTEPFPSEING